jgi:hypothetical protein
LTLKWVVRYKLRDTDNELTVVVRIANPINPLLFLQAALSKAPNDIDNLEFERCPVSVSVAGASQILAEEIFVLIGKWIDSRPQPQYITSVHNKIADNQNTIAFFNYWLFPILVAIIFFLLLWKHKIKRARVGLVFKTESKPSNRLTRCSSRSRFRSRSTGSAELGVGRRNPAVT